MVDYKKKWYSPISVTRKPITKRRWNRLFSKPKADEFPIRSRVTAYEVENIEAPVISNSRKIKQF